jgi:hypothetical protein
MLCRSPGRARIALAPACKVLCGSPHTKLFTHLTFTACQDAAKRLFGACEVGDGGKRADLRLLLKVIQHQDEDVTEADVKSTFEEVGLQIENSVPFHPFYTWTHHVFGSITMDDYLEAVATLTAELEMVKTWAAKIFEKCEKCEHGVILVDDFVRRVLVATPELEAADIEETIENTDGTMQMMDVQFWVAEMLGDCGQEECNELMAILIDAD